MDSSNQQKRALADGIALVLSRYGHEVLGNATVFQQACGEAIDPSNSGLPLFLSGCDARLLASVGEFFGRQEVFSQDGFNAACARLSYLLATEPFANPTASRFFAEQLLEGISSYVNLCGGRIAFAGLPDVRRPEPSKPPIGPSAHEGFSHTTPKNGRKFPWPLVLAVLLVTIVAGGLGFFVLRRGVRIAFDTNGAQSSSLDEVYLRAGESFLMPTSQECMREGYQLAGWSMVANATQEDLLAPGADETANTSCTYVAQWLAEISFDGNGATNGESKVLVAGLDGLLTMPACSFSLEGYSFEGWSIGGSAPVYQPGDVVPGQFEPVTYYAVWTKRDSDESVGESLDGAVMSIVQDGHTYALYDENADWWSARNKCEALGGHLATITSGEEQWVIERLLHAGSRNAYWIGGELGYSGSWKWVTGEPFTFANWAEGAPDNYRPEGRENDSSLVEEALSIYRLANPNAPHPGGSWNDLSGDGECNGEWFFGLDHIGFVCEWEEELEEGLDSKTLSADTMPRSWTGVYEGYSQYADDGVISRSIQIDFSAVSESGGLEGSCVIGVNETGDGAGTGSYEVRGNINWQTGVVTLAGFKWIDQGDLHGMRTFEGVLDPDTWSIEGSSEDMMGNGSHGGDWWMTAY